MLHGLVPSVVEELFEQLDSPEGQRRDGSSSAES